MINIIMMNYIISRVSTAQKLFYKQISSDNEKKMSNTIYNVFKKMKNFKQPVVKFDISDIRLLWIL